MTILKASRAVEVIIEQYGTDGVAEQLVDLSEWYLWLHE